MEDPGFPRIDPNPREGGCTNLLSGKIFTENCMKLKNLERACATSTPLDPPLKKNRE